MFLTKDKRSALIDLCCFNALFWGGFLVAHSHYFIGLFLSVLGSILLWRQEMWWRQAADDVLRMIEEATEE